MKIAAVVILYHPEEASIHNISSYSSFVDVIYAMDNSETPTKDLEKVLRGIINLKYFYDGENKGIANRLNQACKLAIENDYDWLLTMDQDSYFSIDSIKNYLSCIQNLNIKNEVAMFGVEYQNTTSSNECQSLFTNNLITSGSVINLRLFQQIGSFNEELFIDQVDFEYCYQAILKGYKIVQFQSIYLQHQLGKLSTHTSLKSLKKTNRSLHSPIRLYYMTRNYLYMESKFKNNFREDVAHSKKDLLIRIKNNLLYGKNRVQTLEYILLGILHFYQKKMGKLSFSNR